MKITALVQKLQQFGWKCPGLTCISFFYYLSYENYPPKTPVMCHMSHVLCIVPMPLFNHSQTLRARDLQFLHDIHHTLVAMCLVSHVRCHMSLVMCHMSLVTYHMSCDSILILIFSYTLWELVGEGSVFNGASPFLVFRAFIIKNAMIPIFFNF